jgi:hypothetical protein
VQARSIENDYQEGALGMLPEGTGVDAPHVRGAPPLRQQELQDAWAFWHRIRGPPTRTPSCGAGRSSFSPPLHITGLR